MSFSQDIKEELLNQKITSEKCMFAEKLGEHITTSNNLEINNLEFEDMLNNKLCLEAFLKGIFLGSGCIVDPEAVYHLEIIAQNKEYSELIVKALKRIKLKAKTLVRNNSYVIYIKDSEQIATFLSFIHAINSYLKYEQIRVEKDLKNNINRNINCETSNISKTIASSVAHIDAIEYLKEQELFEKLPDNLKETANLREKYRELSLDELSKKSPSKISKSGLNHRLNKIIEIAKKAKGDVSE